ncbi:MAG TPA: C-type lectin domain-containing protein, partial [Polyangium sp.]|nr:C-type lectin domain-containing protein [Polyangium sp.]
GRNNCRYYNGLGCSVASQCLSGYCVDGFCCNNICMNECAACSAEKKGGGYDGVCGPIAATTDPDDECVGGSCTASGTCSNPQAKWVNGTACVSAAQCASGYCADGVCCDSWCQGDCVACTAAKKGGGVDGTCGAIPYDTDPDDECWGGACDGNGVCKQYNGVPCPNTAVCLSGYCADGFCCGNICTSQCSACSTAKKGYGYDGVCEVIASGLDPDHECNPGECDGVGTCNQQQTLQADGIACASAAQCASGHCVDGVCCDSACTGICQACTEQLKRVGPDGTCGPIQYDTDPENECFGGACTGDGHCKQYNGVPCSSPTDCLSNYCVEGVCCNNVCNGLCQSCSAAKKSAGFDGQCGFTAADIDPDNECIPGECNGSGACNQPQTLQANGATCVSGANCASGFCVDGVCCNSACTETCVACTNAKTGYGVDGTCAPILYDTDPEEECWGGACSGFGECKLYNGVACATTEQCLSNYCVDGFCCGNICTSTCMACSTAKKGYGFDGVCEHISNGQDPDNECNPGECDGAGVCNQVQTGLANGAACSQSVQCISGFCVDGFCCNSACSGTCQSCSAAISNQVNGQCSFIWRGLDPEDDCGDERCDGFGVCTLPNGSACSNPQQCTSGICFYSTCSASEPPCISTMYGGHAYRICKGSYNNAQAENECANVGMTLAFVDDKAENTFLVDSANQAYGCLEWHLTAFWVGNRASSTPSTWSDGSARWAPGEPSGDGDYIHLQRFCGVNRYGWNDVPPQISHGYICETSGAPAFAP